MCSKNTVHLEIFRFHSMVLTAHMISVLEFVVCLCFIEDLLTAKAKPPSEKEFLDAFQKFKYSFSLLVSHESVSMYIYKQYFNDG